MSGSEVSVAPWAALQAGLPHGSVLVTDSGQGPVGQVLLTPRHVAFADVSSALNGEDSGPNPHDLVLMALGACTAMTIRLYAARKAWQVDRIAVRLSYGVAVALAESDGRDDRRIDRVIEIDGPLDETQRARLLDIAGKCPVHNMLTAGVSISSSLTPAV
jgi:putative redox protein